MLITQNVVNKNRIRSVPYLHPACSWKVWSLWHAWFVWTTSRVCVKKVLPHHPYLSIVVYWLSYNRCPNTCDNTCDRIEEKLQNGGQREQQIIPTLASYWCCPPFWNDCCNITVSFFNRPQVKKDNGYMKVNRPHSIGRGAHRHIRELLSNPHIAYMGYYLDPTHCFNFIINPFMSISTIVKLTDTSFRGPKRHQKAVGRLRNEQIPPIVWPILKMPTPIPQSESSPSLVSTDPAYTF